ncbi:MAG: helix-turn-helix domain-containing protein [Candidatus Woesearchaeota archaeon]
MDKEILTRIGFSKAESIIYLVVLKLGTCTVKDISKDCGFHRTNIYDILEQLREKGLITEHKLGKALQYKAADPENLYNFLKEKQMTLDQLMPNLKELQELHKEEVEVLVFKGPEGMKSAFRDMIRTKDTIYGFGVRGQIREHLPTFAQQFTRDLKNFGIKYYGIYSRDAEKPSYYTEIRTVPKELSSPVATLIYGDKVLISIWEPTMIGIVIKSKNVAETYKKHFQLLWKIAKPS